MSNSDCQAFELRAEGAGCYLLLDQRSRLDHFGEVVEHDASLSVIAKGMKRISQSGVRYSYESALVWADLARGGTCVDALHRLP